MLKKTLFVGGFLVAGLSLIGGGCAQEVSAPTTPNSGQVTTDVTSQGPKKVTESDSKLNYIITFPTDIFQSTTFGKDAHLGLTSDYYIEENSTGKPGDEVKHTYSVLFSQTEKSIDDTLKQDNPNAFAELTKMKKGQKVDANFFTSSKVDGKDAYVVTMGAEGTNMKTYYVVRDTNKTFMIRLNYIGDSRANSMKPTMLSEAKQMEYFNQVLQSFKFSK